MVESAQNQAHPTRLSKIYVHTKFQLIWPLNGQENPKNPLFLGLPIVRVIIILISPNAIVYIYPALALCLTPHEPGIACLIR